MKAPQQTQATPSEGTETTDTPRVLLHERATGPPAIADSNKGLKGLGCVFTSHTPAIERGVVWVVKSVLDTPEPPDGLSAWVR